MRGRISVAAGLAFALAAASAAPAAGFVEGVLVGSGDKISAAIDVVDDTDAFTVGAGAGGKISATVAAAKGSVVLPGLRLFDPSGAEADVSLLLKGVGGKKVSLRNFVVPAGKTGEWTFVVSGGSTTGAYAATFKVADLKKVVRKALVVPDGQEVVVSFPTAAGTTVTGRVKVLAGTAPGTFLFRADAAAGGGAALLVPLFSAARAAAADAPVESRTRQESAVALVQAGGAGDCTLDLTLRIKTPKVLKRKVFLPPEGFVSAAVPGILRQGLPQGLALDGLFLLGEPSPRLLLTLPGESNPDSVLTVTNADFAGSPETDVTSGIVHRPGAQLTVTVAGNAPYGSRDILYVPPPLLGEPSRLAGAFNVFAPVPTVGSVSPPIVRQEQGGIVLTITGTGFRSGGTVSIPGTGIVVGATTVVNATTATVTVSLDPDATVGTRDITFTQEAVAGAAMGTGTGILQVRNPLPSIASMNPAQFRQEESGVAVTVTGSGFRSGGVLSVSGSGVVVDTATAQSGTSVLASISVASGAATGARSLTWTQPLAGGGDSTTAVGILVVNFPVPAVASLSQSSIRQEATNVTLTVTGSRFRAGGAITFSGTGITTGSTNVVNATTATVVVSVSESAALGARDVTFTQAAAGGGASGTLPSGLGVLYPVPTLASVFPGFVRQEEVNNLLSILGTGLRPGGVISISGTGITLGSTQVQSSLDLSVPITVAADATLGNRTVTYTQPADGGGGIATISLFVRGPLVTISSVSPSIIRQEDSGVLITVTGSGFRSGGSLSIQGSVTVTSTTVVDANTVTALVSVNQAASPGERDITWSHPPAGGSETFSKGGLLTLLYPIPVFSSFSPSVIRQEDIQNSITVTGTGFRNGMTLSLSGTGYTKTGTTFTSTTSIGIIVTVDSTAAIGPRDFVYVNEAAGGGETTTRTGAVTLNYPVPSIGSTSPDTVTQGTSNVTLTLSGSRFRDGGSVSAGSDIAVSNVVFESVNQVHCTINVDAAAAMGPRSVSYTQPSNGGADKGTRVNGLQVNAPTPTVTSVNNSIVKQGDASVARFLTGTNFRSGGTLSVTGTGLTVGGVVVTSATRVDFNLSATSACAIGARDVTWTQPALGGGASATLPSGTTVNYPDPTITSISPVKLDRNSSNQVLTLTGTNFRSGGTVSIGGGEVTLTSPTFVSETSFTVLASVTSTAALGFRNVTYTHTGGGAASATKPSALEITPEGVDLSSLAPFAWLPGTARFRCVATGVNFNSGTTVSVSGSGVTVHSTTFDSSTKLTMEVSVDSSASLGSRDVTITPGSGGGSTKTFTGAAIIAMAPPAIGSFAGPTLAQGATSAAVTILGSGFRSGDTIAAGGSGVTFSSVTIVDEGKITATAAVDGAAATGARSLTVTRSSSNGGLSATLSPAFTITGASPTLSAVNPSKVGRTGSGGATRQVPVTLTGTNFMAGATLSVAKTSASGLSVVSSSEVVVSDTTMTAVLSITGTATTGTWDLTVTNPGSLGNSGSGGAGLLDVKDENTLCVNRVVASSGSAFGGERVTVYGSGFASGAVVDFGSVRAAGTQFLDKGTIVTTVPLPSAQSPTAPRTVDVVVTLPNASSATLTGGYTYAKDDGEFKVVSIFPAQGATGVPKNLVSAVVRLSYPADTTSGTYGSTTGTNCFWFESGGSSLSAGLRGFGPGGRLLVFSRTDGGNLAIANAGKYVLDVPSALHSLGGNPLSPQRIQSVSHDQYTFTISSSATDTTAPTLSTITPSNSSSGIDVTTTVKIVFSEEIDPLTVNATNITFKQSSTVIGADLALSDDLKTVTITPHAVLAASTQYTTNVTASVKDLFGNAYSNTSYTFTTGSGTDATAPVVTAVILEELPADMDGSGTFVDGSGTGGNAFDVYLPQFGWLVDVRFSDDGGAGIDVASFSAKANVAVGGNSSNAELASNFTITPTGATWRIPSSGFAAADNDTFTFTVKDLAGNASSSKVVTFDVVSKDTSAAGGGGDHDPFDARRTWILRGDIDAYTATYSTTNTPSNKQGATTTVATSGVPDLDEALRLVGLNTASMTTDAANAVRGGDTGTNAILKRLYLERLREAMRERYHISEDGVHDAGSVDVEFLLAGEQGSLSSMPTYSTANSSFSGKAFSELSIGGTLGADASAFTAGGTLGQAWLDPRNLGEEANLNFGVADNITGIYLMGMLKLQVNSSLTDSIFGSRVSKKLVTIHGGTPAGEGSLDDDVLAGSFDRTSGGNSAAQNTRYDEIMDAVELVALYTSAVAAHEVGHSTGLVPDGAPKTGLFGNAHYANTFTEATSANPNTSAHLDFLGNDIMAASTSFESGVTTGADFKRFSPMDIAYLRNRLVHDEGK